MGTLAAQNQILTFSDEDELGGQTFNKFPETTAEVAQFWSEVWFACIEDLIAPPITAPPAASKATWASTMEALVTVPGGGIAALDAAAVAAFPALAAAIAPNLINLPPPAPFTAILTPALAPFVIAGTSDPIPPAAAFAGALSSWIATAKFTPPGPPAPAPFQVAP